MAWVGVYSSSSSSSPDPQLKILEFRIEEVDLGELGKVNFLPRLKQTKSFFFFFC